MVNQNSERDLTQSPSVSAAPPGVLTPVHTTRHVYLGDADGDDEHRGREAVGSFQLFLHLSIHIQIHSLFYLQILSNQIPTRP
ncbi:hypothetical protein Celaphus_00002712 [Cervus elaphus hippelaphus]|uniref:Uncharacterized protein n=1 Tax=Cervus elaphus hippelaphus TaxID=46360 RepID=A0A212CGS6_CEREH|nr:hypothetical protein Celaphus_00002712 [Cervus elaphus hippelaphus]